MNKLEKYFEENQGRLIIKCIHYFDIYDRYFSKFINQDVHILEIGVFHGGSLQMWRDYFGNHAKIYGVDIDYRCKEFEEEGIKIFIGSQEDRAFLKDLKSQIPKIDILIDDGGHTMNQQINTFEELFPHVSENGIYLCEDLQTNYMANYGGGYGNKKTFIEYSKNFIDYLNAWHSEEEEKLKVEDFTHSAYSMHYYDSVLLIEKSKRIKPSMKITGKNSFGTMNQEVAQEKIAGYRKALKLNPQDFSAYKNLGDIFKRQGQQTKAIAAYQSALKLKENPAVYCSLGGIQCKQRDWSGAISSYQKALELHDQQPFLIYPAWVYQQLGKTFFQQGELDAALNAYEESIKLDPENVDSYVLVGKTQLKKGEGEKAIAAYEKAIALNPNQIVAEKHIAAYKGLGDVYLEGENYPSAIATYKKAIKLMPKQNFGIDKRLGFGVCKSLGDALRKEGKIEEAIAAYQEALKLQPQNQRIPKILPKLELQLAKNSNQ